MLKMTENIMTEIILFLNHPLFSTWFCFRFCWEEKKGWRIRCCFFFFFGGFCAGSNFYFTETPHNFSSASGCVVINLSAFSKINTVQQSELLSADWSFIFQEGVWEAWLKNKSHWNSLGGETEGVGRTAVPVLLPNEISWIYTRENLWPEGLHFL